MVPNCCTSWIQFRNTITNLYSAQRGRFEVKFCRMCLIYKINSSSLYILTVSGIASINYYHFTVFRARIDTKAVSLSTTLQVLMTSSPVLPKNTNIGSSYRSRSWAHSSVTPKRVVLPVWRIFCMIKNGVSNHRLLHISLLLPQYKETKLH